MPPSPHAPRRPARLTAALCALALACGAGPLAAQDSAPQAASPQSEIVVTARRAGAPMWTIETPTGTVILVGEIRRVPKATPWFPDRLEEATSEADRVIIGSRPKFSPGDFFRLVFRGGKFLKLPDKTVASDYLDSAQRARLAALEAQYEQDYDRGSFLITAFDLLARRLDFDDETLDDDATDIVKNAAEKGDIAILRPERFRGEDLLDDLAAAAPESHIPCLEAAMTATEAGPAIIEQRGRDWTSLNVKGVMANPLEIALGRCWPWADPEVGNEIRDQWTQMIEAAAADKGTTLGVVPLRLLAERGGVLDQLETRGFAIYGPDWRTR